MGSLGASLSGCMGGCFAQLPRSASCNLVQLKVPPVELEEPRSLTISPIHPVGRVSMVITRDGRTLDDAPLPAKGVNELVQMKVQFVEEEDHVKSV